MPEVSIIVPVYKVEKYIRRCIDSILRQTFKDFELILVDDGSPDNCGFICDEYATRDDRIVVIHQNNRGLSAARNVGLDSMKGRYVAFIDSDDYVYPAYLEYLYNALTENGADMSVCGTIEFYDNPPDLMLSDNAQMIFRGIQLCDYLCDYQKANGLVAAWGKLYCAHIFRDLRFPEGKLHEDQFVMHKIFYNCKNVVVLQSKLYGYFINQYGITKSGFSLKRYDNVEAMENNAAFYKQHNEEELACKAERLGTLICAMFSIYARESGVYKNTPKCYRMTIYRAGKIIRNELGNNVYEWHMAKIMPNVIKFQSYFRKILTSIGVLMKVQ